MKKIFFIAIYCLINITVCVGQDFSFPVYFENGKGIRDTITIGYSQGATDSVDVAFGEDTIPESSIDTTFDVYMSNAITDESGTVQPREFRLKKQIVSPSNDNDYFFANVDVICKDFPLTISWDKSLFVDSSRAESFLTTCGPGGWFDACGTITYTLVSEDSIRIELPDLTDNASYYYDTIQGGKVTVWEMYIGFSPEGGIFHVNTTNITIGHCIAYPNPCEKSLHIVCNGTKPANLQLTDLSGTILRTEQYADSEKELDMTGLHPGTYLLQIEQDGNKNTYSIIKK